MKFFAPPKTTSSGDVSVPSNIHKPGKLNVNNLEENVWVPSRKTKKTESLSSTQPASPPTPSSPSSGNLFDTLAKQEQIRRTIAAAKTTPTSPTRAIDEQQTPAVLAF